jgi:hypothetical protein
MLLSKIPVLDKGYVALIDSCNTTAKLREMGQEFFGGEYPTSLEELGSMTVVMKCPLFVQLNLSKFNFKVINADSGSPEGYIPNPGEIGASERISCEAISDDIARTTDALLINPKAYQADGADRFVSQVLTPVNIYTTLIVQGTYREWCAFAYNQAKVPTPIKAYTIALQQIIDAEWK